MGPGWLDVWSLQRGVRCSHRITTNFRLQGRLLHQATRLEDGRKARRRIVSVSATTCCRAMRHSAAAASHRSSKPITRSNPLHHTAVRSRYCSCSGHHHLDNDNHEFLLGMQTQGRSPVRFRHAADAVEQNTELCSYTHSCRRDILFQ